MSKRKKQREIEEEYEFVGLSPETKRWIIIVILFTAGLLSILSFLGWAGIVGQYIDKFLGLTLGWLKFLFPLFVIVLGFVLSKSDKYYISGVNYFGLIILFFSSTALMHLYYPLEQLIGKALSGEGGGVVGLVLSYPLLKFTSLSASLIILIALFLIAILITFNTTLELLAQRWGFLAMPLRIILHPFKKLSSLFGNKTNKFDDEYEEDESEYEEEVDDEYEESADQDEEGDGEIEDEEIEDEEENKSGFMSKFVKAKKTDDAEPIQTQAPLVKRRKIDLPIKLLENKSAKPDGGDIDLIKDKIENTFENFGIDVEMGEVNVGPTVTQYTMRPADGIKLSRITSLNNDLSLSLAAHPIRIEAPIPGKSLVGIEVPNEGVSVVPLREVVESKNFKQKDIMLPFGLGKDVKGNPCVVALEKMPHMLIAGATGSGKSVCINSLIVSLLYRHGPDDLKFIMVDPKRVELTNYNNIPHLITPVITDSKKTINALKWCIGEMDRRFELLSKCGHRNIITHNANSQSKLPYIVFIIDELADLMAVAASDVEAAIIRLAQMARAVGIHLVLATQRPSVDVITGLIKANITGRIAFSVASAMDSRTILDTSGAEKLVGRGDMLYSSAELSKPKRLQGTYLSDQEIKRVVSYLKENGTPDYADDIVERTTSDPISNFSSDDDTGDELFEEAKEIVIRAEKASASLLQRRLKVGYARAARLLDLMEERGIVGPSQGAKPRELLVGEEALSIKQTYGNDVENNNTEEEYDEDKEAEYEEDVEEAGEEEV